MASSEVASTASAASKTRGRKQAENIYNDLSDDELRRSLEEMTRIVRILTLENEVLKQYLTRKEPQSLEKLSVIEEAARQAQKISALPAQGSVRTEGSSSTMRSRQSSRDTGQKSASGSQQVSRPAASSTGGVKVVVDHRVALANKEVELMEKNYSNFEKGVKRKKFNLDLVLEETRYQIKERNDAIRTFETEVIERPDPITKKISLDTFTKFNQDQAKMTKNMNDKLNLKIITTKRLITQTKKQIAQREDIGSNLRPIDFKKVEIENEYLVEENERNNNNLNEYKRIKRHYNLVLKDHSEKLMSRKAALRALKSSLIWKNQENVELRRRQTRVKREVKKAQSQLRAIKELEENYEKPEVTDFLHVQRELHEEEKKYKRLKRQRKIQLFTLRPKKVQAALPF